MTPLQQHIAAWSGCTRCPLHETRKSVVLVRGTVPADLCFLGEAPGFSEDAIGQPFIGPAGQELDRWIRKAGLDQIPKAFINLLACIPLGENGSKVNEPDDEDVKKCSPRLIEIVTLIKPKRIVCVGTYSRDWLDEKRKRHIELNRPIPRLDIVHPAAVLRANVAQRDIMVRRAVIALANLRSELCPQSP